VIIVSAEDGELRRESIKGLENPGRWPASRSSKRRRHIHDDVEIEAHEVDGRLAVSSPEPRSATNDDFGELGRGRPTCEIGLTKTAQGPKEVIARTLTKEIEIEEHARDEELI
jgi:hypothetical protein